MGKIRGRSMLRKSLTLAVMVAAATPAYAGDKYVVQPLPLGQVNVRYYKGTPTVALTQKDGMVQIVPLSFDHGSISFSLAVFNDGEAPANIDLANLIVTIDGRPVAKLSRQALERKAKNRAMWQQIGIGLAGGLAAAAAASQRDHYRATTFTPYGTYSTFVSAPSRDGQLTGALLAAGTGAGIYAVQKKLEATLDALGDQIVQTTTVDGRGGSYAGRVVLEKVKLPPRGIAKMELVVLWNGQKYPFLFQVAPNGTPMPVFDNPPPVAATTAEPIAPAGAPAPIAAPAAAPPVAPPPAAPSAASSAATVG